MQDQITLRSAVKEEFLQRTLIKGMTISTAGVALLFYGGIYSSKNYLEDWGWLLFILAVVCIALGALPYRRLAVLARKPHEIHLTGEVLTFSFQGTPLFALPLSVIDKVDFAESSSLYGIGCSLKADISPQFLLSKNDSKVIFFQKTNSQFDYDLFLPFFSQASCRELQEVIEEIS